MPYDTIHLYCRIGLEPRTACLRVPRHRIETMSTANQIDYVELPASDIEKTKTFYQAVFGWKFEDYGPEYTSFHDGRLAGGFTKERQAPAKGLLLVIYGSDLTAV